ncbi:MAG TPA: cytochrome c [Chryseolinea sp.]|nr:cytochrome c [Chryseolinea sp.]
MERIKSLQPTAYSLQLAVSFLLSAFCLLLSCQKTDNSETSSPKFKQYFVQGEKLYLQHCSNCHQKNGAGLGLLYPPLDTSDYMQNHLEDVVCLIKNGKYGELIVNGKNYNQAMPGVPSLTDLEIAEITTFIYNSWSHEAGIVDVNRVSKILSTCDSLKPQ